MVCIDIDCSTDGEATAEARPVSVDAATGKDDSIDDNPIEEEEVIENGGAPEIGAAAKDVDADEDGATPDICAATNDTDADEEDTVLRED